MNRRKPGLMVLLLVGCGTAAWIAGARADVPAGVVQLDPTHTLKDGVVTEQGVAVMTVKSQQSDQWTEGHQVTTPANVPVFSVVMMTQNGSKVSTVEFPMLNRNFEARFPPDTTIVTLLQSFFRNHVIVDNKPSLAGLDAYCAARNLTCKDTRAQLARESAAAKQGQCKGCREDYRACQVQKALERQHPRPGVTIETAETSCEHRYRACSFGGDMFLHGARPPQPDDWPCGKIEP